MKTLTGLKDLGYSDNEHAKENAASGTGPHIVVISRELMVRS